MCLDWQIHLPEREGKYPCPYCQRINDIDELGEAYCESCGIGHIIGPWPLVSAQEQRRNQLISAAKTYQSI